MPHITLRFFNDDDPKTDYIGYLTQRKISYLNIIGPGTFNLEKNRSSYVVFLRCESEELEEIDYRPDYPYSRLHITLYEGSDRQYAETLYNELAKHPWLIRMTFTSPKSISKRTLGSKTSNEFDYQRAYQEILNEERQFPNVEMLNFGQKLDLIRSILKKMSLYLRNLPPIKPIYVLESTKNLVEKSEIECVSGGRYISSEFPEGIAELAEEDKMVTSPEYARDMAACALELFGEDTREIHFGDSAIGTGALFIAIKRLVDVVNREQNKHYKFGSSIGIDIDRDRAQEAFKKCSTRKLQVVLGDALSPKTDLGSARNMMLVNPPYTRSSRTNIPIQYRKCAKQWAKDVTGIDIPGDAGLYVYHLLIMHKWLADDGIAVWLLPTAFLYAKYGKAIRDYLANKVQLLRLHIYNEKAVQFEKADIATTVVAFKNRIPDPKTTVRVTWGDSMEQPRSSVNMVLSQFSDSIQNWRNLIFDNFQERSFDNSPKMEFSDLFDIKRGLATGANSFFVLKKEEAEAHGIPAIALRPILPKARYLQSLTIRDRGDGYPAVEPLLALIDCSLNESEIGERYPEFFDYLQQAKKKNDNGSAIIDRALVKSRSPWYKQELRDPPLFLLTYMGRNKKDLPPLYFILNQSKAVALNTYILLYPKPWLAALLNNNTKLSEELLESLNETAKQIIAYQTRVYSGGLQKIEPNELKKFPLVDLPSAVNNAYKEAVGNIELP